VRIELPEGHSHVVTAGDLSAAGARTSVSMRFDGAAVGSITVVDPSRHSEGLTLLSRLAALAAPAAIDMRTMAELRQLRSRIQAGNADLAASRSRLARAEAEERAQLRHIVQVEVLPAVLDLRHALPTLEAIRAGDVHGRDLEYAALQSRELAQKIRGLAHDVLPPVLAGRGLAAALRAHVRRLGADVTLTVPASRRLPESMEAALYACGRLLVDTVGGTSGPVALTLTVSAEDVQLAVTATTEGDDVGDNLREHALRLLGDRLGVLGGALMTASSERVTEIRCHVPLTAESKGAEEGRSDAFEHAIQTPAQFLPGPGGATTRVNTADSTGIR
jgi:signal transduction histidine kinase